MNALDMLCDYMVEVGGCPDRSAVLRVMEAQGTQRFAELVLALAQEISGSPTAVATQGTMVDRIAPIIGALGEPR